MGLPTGVEVKTEPVTAEETTVAATVEDSKPVVLSVENTAAAAAASAISTTAATAAPAAAAEGTASTDTAETVEVQNSSWFLSI